MFFAHKNHRPDFIEAFGFTQSDCTSRVAARNFCSISYRFCAQDTKFTWAGGSCLVQTGDVVFVPSGLAYVRSCRLDEVGVIHFALGGAWREPEVLRPSDPEVFARLFSRAVASFGGGGGADYRTAAILYEILAAAAEQSAVVEDADFEKIRLGYELAGKDFCSRDLSVAMLARASGMSEVSFRAAFKRAVGMSPRAYITSLRIKTAARMLAEGLGVERTASETGFCDAKYFSAVFKKATGACPRDYRFPGGERFEGCWDGAARP